MTPFLQPIDQFRPLKLSYQRKWNNWMRTAPKAYTSAGNHLATHAFSNGSPNWLDSNLIARSFKYCGVTSNNLTDYGSQLRHFVRTSEFVVNLEYSMDDAGLKCRRWVASRNPGHSWLTRREERLWQWIIIVIVYFSILFQANIKSIYFLPIENFIFVKHEL